MQYFIFYNGRKLEKEEKLQWLTENPLEKIV